MKKLLLSAALLAATSSFAAQDKFYLTGAAGMSMVPNYKINDVKYKTSNAFIGDIGAGYNITDSTRIDVIFTKQFDVKSVGSVSKDMATLLPQIHPNFIQAQLGVRLNAAQQAQLLGLLNAAQAQLAGIASYETTTKRSINANAFMARMHQDIYNYGKGKIFLTGGMGVARVQEKITGSIVSPIDSGIFTGHSLKSKYNLAFNIGAGTSVELQENVMLDLSVDYTDFGKAKSKKLKGRDLFPSGSQSQTLQILNALYGNRAFSINSKNLRAVSLKAGIRVNL